MLKRWVLGFLILVALFTLLVSINKSTAGLPDSIFSTRVEIDGKNYGPFNEIRDLYDIASINHLDDRQYIKVTLKRDFITDPSLYQWAKGTMHNRINQNDVHLVLTDGNGNEISRYILKYCQPLSWTVESTSPSLGGFHETIDLAVKDIEVK